MTLNETRKKVFDERPVFGRIIEQWKNRTWIDYYLQKFEGLANPSADILNTIEEETSKILGDQIAKQARESIEENKWSDTADHHGVLMHQYFYTASLARSHKKVISKSKATVVLPFGNISLTNDSFPRGIFFKDKNFKEQRIYFKSLASRSLPVFGLEAMTKKDLKSERDRAMSLELSETAKHRLLQFLEAIMGDERIWSKKLYSEQLTLINQILWKMLFGESRGELVYLEIDSVVRNLLLSKHLRQETNIYHLIFNPAWRKNFLDKFDNVRGSHQDKRKGTHLFWYVDRNKKCRRELYIEENNLETKEKDISIAISPEEIISKIESRELMPSSALLLIVAHCEEKLACAGGFSQVQYLAEIAEAWRKVVSECVGEINLPDGKPNPSIFSGEFVIAGIACGNEKAPASLIDILLYGNRQNDTIDTALEETTIEASVDAMIPTLFWLITRRKEAIENYLNIPIIGDVKN